MYCKARNKRYRKETLGSSSDFVGVKSTAFQSKWTHLIHSSSLPLYIVDDKDNKIHQFAATAF